MVISLLQWLENERVDHAPFDIDDVECEQAPITPVAAGVRRPTVAIAGAIAIRKRRQPRATRG